MKKDMSLCRGGGKMDICSVIGVKMDTCPKCGMWVISPMPQEASPGGRGRFAFMNYSFSFDVVDEVHRRVVLNEKFNPKEWTVRDAEMLECAANKIKAGLWELAQKGE